MWSDANPEKWMTEIIRCPFTTPSHLGGRGNLLRYHNSGQITTNRKWMANLCLGWHGRTWWNALPYPLPPIFQALHIENKVPGRKGLSIVFPRHEAFTMQQFFLLCALTFSLKLTTSGMPLVDAELLRQGGTAVGVCLPPLPPAPQYSPCLECSWEVLHTDGPGKVQCACWGQTQQSSLGLHGLHGNHSLSQVMTGPTHQSSHTLDLVFCLLQDVGELKVRNVCLTPVSWTDHYLVEIRLIGMQWLCEWWQKPFLVQP